MRGDVVIISMLAQGRAALRYLRVVRSVISGGRMEVVWRRLWRPQRQLQGASRCTSMAMPRLRQAVSFLGEATLSPG